MDTPRGDACEAALDDARQVAANLNSMKPQDISGSVATIRSAAATWPAGRAFGGETAVGALVDAIGVTVLEADRAEPRLNSTVNATDDGIAAPSASGPLLPRMELVDGRRPVADIVER